MLKPALVPNVSKNKEIVEALQYHMRKLIQPDKQLYVRKGTMHSSTIHVPQHMHKPTPSYLARSLYLGNISLPSPLYFCCSHDGDEGIVQ